MSDRVEQNKATVTHMLERLSAGDISGFTDALVPHYLRHSQAMPSALQEIRGRDAMHQRLAANLVPFPDYREELEWLVGEGDFAAWRSRGRGTRWPTRTISCDLVSLLRQCRRVVCCDVRSALQTE